MAQYFFDSSAIVKYYHPEAGTAAVTAIFAESARRIRISSLGFVEIQSAFAMKVRSGILDGKAAGLQRARLLLDVAAGDIEVYDVIEDHFATAERLIARHSFTRRLRTLDAIQLAVVLDLNSHGLVDHFVVADKPFAEVAAMEGLNVIDPNPR